MFQVPERFRVRTGDVISDAGLVKEGWFRVPVNGKNLKVIASNGEGWEHVSVSLPNRTPDWTEMCAIKKLFWDAEDCVIQYHPPEGVYKNVHPFCLHLWRPVNFNLPTPPIEFV